MNREALKASLIAHEGIRFTPYVDQTGHSTIGCGHNQSVPISQSVVDLMLANDIDIAVSELDRAFTGWRNHSEARQTVLAELLFNVGAPTLSKFTRFWFAMQQKDYDTASQELISSKWAKQVGQRAETLAKRLREGLLA